MRARRFAVGLVALVALGLAGSAVAQDAPAQPKDQKLIDRIDNFGKSIFSGILPNEKNKGRPRTPASQVASSEAAADLDPAAHGKRAGSILEGRNTSRQRSVLDTRVDDDGMTPENTPPLSMRAADGMPKTVRQPLSGSSLLDEPAAAPRMERQLPKAASGATVAAEASTPNIQDDSPTIKRPSVPPIYRRLSASRRSVFDEEAGEGISAAPQSKAEPKAEPKTEPTPAEPRTSVLPQTSRPSVATEPEPKREVISKPAVIQPEREELPSRPARAVVPSPASSATVETEKPPVRPYVAQRTRQSIIVGAATAAEPTTSSTTSTTPKAEKAANQRLPLLVEPGVSAARRDGDDGLLMARKGPALSVETLGPRKIAVGRESSYEVNIVNSGEVAAEDLIVFVTMPDWTEVGAAQSSNGAVVANAGLAGTLQWRLGHLDAKGRERLTLKIVPRQSKPFDLAVRWEYRPIASQAMIEVQEAKLSLQLEGPREVVYGKKETYRLRLINSGNGAAENVAIMLMPLGGGDNVPATHKLGVLPAGEEKVLDIELTARQAGGLTIQVDARADGGVRAELAEKVLVRRAGLTVDVQGPKVQFVQAPATYTIRIRNPGTAPARNVKLSIVLPAGARYLSGIEGARLDVASGRLDWTVDNLSPEVEQSFALRCTLGNAGMSRLQVNATAADDLTTSAAAITQVEAVANLAMEVMDPEGPVAVGEEATYEVHVRNRGTREAANVEVFAYFSRGIEPMAAEGAPNRVGPGQVTFQPISSLAPGAEAVFRIRARADIAGNHVFRAEAHCKPLSARLIREATNLYYTDATATSASTMQPGMESVPSNAMRTVTRPPAAKPFTPPPRQ